MLNIPKNFRVNNNEEELKKIKTLANQKNIMIDNYTDIQVVYNDLVNKLINEVFETCNTYEEAEVYLLSRCKSTHAVKESALLMIKHMIMQTPLKLVATHYSTDSTETTEETE